MAQVALSAPARSRALGVFVFPVAIFASAALVFFVEPMVAKLVLPLLGGSSAVWNTSLAFFQGALLLGYLYAHAIQRVRSVRTQALIHLGMLIAAGTTLPLRLSTLIGEPPVGAPTLWLLGELALTIGAPFAVLSATAPLLQAWHARTTDADDAKGVFSLYAASNLGSLLALAAYPFIVEPHLTLVEQRGAWTVGYGLFAALVLLVYSQLKREEPPSAAATRAAVATAAPSWATRITWVLLAAAPSSLVLGVTTHLTANVGSAPFFWVLPLALYLLTFVIAFGRLGERLPQGALLAVHGAALIAGVIAIGLTSTSWLLQFPVNLVAFFLAALVCHLTLVDRKPAPERLTEFYLLISLGGVIGGSFNAFLAPSLFPNAWEYPLVLALCALARPWNLLSSSRRDWLVMCGGLVAVAAVAAMIVTGVMPTILFLAALIAAFGACIGLRNRGLGFAALTAALAITAQLGANLQGAVVKRSFFGIHHVITKTEPGLGQVRELVHGSILHGAQRLNPAHACEPLTYYAPPTPLARALKLGRAGKANAEIGVVGLGAGTVAAYTAPGDHLRFYEIDPAVVDIARDGGLFSFVSPTCAKGRIDYSIGDGRLGLAHAAPASLDVLMIDAFSSDSVPTHLLTTEAMAVYLKALKPDGVLILHLSNRNLSLIGPAAATAKAAGAAARVELFIAPPEQAPRVKSSAVMVLARSPATLAAFAHDPRWKPAPDTGQRPWTDDYVNVLGAMVAHIQGRP